MDSGQHVPFNPSPDGSSVGFFVPYEPQPVYKPRWWLHILLFVATLASTTFIGALFWADVPTELFSLPLLNLLTHRAFLLGGLKFSIPLVTILLCHEMGHYFAARIHGLTATPPYFIPFPLPIFGIGTLGAVIRIKEPIRNKRQLLDVGAAGPLCGFLALLPFLAYGIMASRITAGTPEGGYLIFGEPLLYKIMEHVIRSDVAEGSTLMLHPTGVAAWFGILVTLLNLLPFAQLDGGHVSYSLFGRWHRRLAWPLLGGLIALGVWWPGWWLWALIALIMRPQHPRIWDEERSLGPFRTAIAWFTIAVFILCFMAVPIELFM